MLELMDFITLGMVCAFFSLIFAVIVGVVSTMVRDYRLTRLEDQVERLTMRANNELAQEAKGQNKAREQEAMVKAAAIMQNPNVPDKKGELMKLAFEYPDVAMKMAKKFGVSI